MNTTSYCPVCNADPTLAPCSCEQARPIDPEAGQEIMRKIDNKIKHDPENDQRGDCFRVCMAMVLGLEPELVPHFYRQGEAGDRDQVQHEIDRFLDDYDLVECSIAYPVEDYELILATMKNLSPKVAFILGGMSTSGCGHSVACFDGAIHHDPTGEGIVGPMPDGFFWVYLYAAKPAAFAQRGHRSGDTARVAQNKTLEKLVGGSGK